MELQTLKNLQSDSMRMTKNESNLLCFVSLSSALIFQKRFCALSRLIAARNQSLNPHQCQSLLACVMSCFDIGFVHI